MASKQADVIIIGSGAAGGIVARTLCEKGIKVLMLDAGRKIERSEFKTHHWSYQMPRRGFGLPGRPFADEYSENIFLDPAEQPYSTPPDKPFELVRVWNVGGKTLVWGRVALRLSDYDFKAASRDGYGEDWPISYADLKPYYDRVDRLIGVCGTKENLEILPDGIFMPPPKPRCGERLLQKAGNKLGIKVIPIRRAVLTRPYDGRPPCHYCGECGRGCDVGAFFDSRSVMVERAEATGNLTLLTNAVASEVLVDDRGLARGVRYFDRYSGKDFEVFGRTVVVAASCVDSIRILLNSKSTQFPGGIANDHGQVGKYFKEHIRTKSIVGLLPELKGSPITNEDGLGGAHVYIPRFDHTRKNDYLRGFAFQCWATGATRFPGHAFQTGGFGAAFKKEVRTNYPAVVRLHGYGEVLDYEHNYVDLDPARRDRYGMPLARLHYTIGDNERRMTKAMYEWGAQILEAAGAEIISLPDGPDAPGKTIHEIGGCRMGTDPRTSVVNSFGQAHEVKNLFVTDASIFVTTSEKNPTITILALALRGSEYLAEEMRKGNL